MHELISGQLNSEDLFPGGLEACLSNGRLPLIIENFKHQGKRLTAYLPPSDATLEGEWRRDGRAWKYYRSQQGTEGYVPQTIDFNYADIVDKQNVPPQGLATVDWGTISITMSYLATQMRGEIKPYTDEEWRFLRD